MLRTAISWFLLCLGLVNLLAAVRLSIWLAGEGRTLTVLDPARATAALVRDRPKAGGIRDLALREALRVRFGWGRYHDQDPEALQRFRDAYWRKVTIEESCRDLGKTDLSPDRIVWGGNFAKVHFRETGRILQINFWRMRRGEARIVNPTGWVFSARLSLIENKGLGL